MLGMASTNAAATLPIGSAGINTTAATAPIATTATTAMTATSGDGGGGDLLGFDDLFGGGASQTAAAPGVSLIYFCLPNIYLVCN